MNWTDLMWLVIMMNSLASTYLIFAVRRPNGKPIGDIKKPTAAPPTPSSTEWVGLLDIPEGSFDDEGSFDEIDTEIGTWERPTFCPTVDKRCGFCRSCTEIPEAMQPDKPWPRS